MEDRASELLDNADDSATADEILSDIYIELGNQAKEAATETSTDDSGE